MRIPGVKTVKALTRWAQARLLGGATILGYHRVTDATRDHYGMCIGPQHFAEQMEVIRRLARPVSLLKLLQQLRNGSLEPRSIAITFDDGYADNFYQAKPILEEYEIPATVFICTGYAGREFWWDELERLIMSSAAKRDLLQLWAQASAFGLQRTMVSHQKRGSQHLLTRGQLHQMLYRWMLAMDVEELGCAMKAVRSWAGPVSAAAPTDRAMNRAELLQLVNSGLIELGAHTHNHAMLPYLPLQRQAEEILKSRQELEDLLALPVAGFSYPNGRTTVDAKRVAREAGFVYGCTSLHNMVRPGCDVYELSRFWQRDVDGDTFMRNLRSWTAI